MSFEVNTTGLAQFVAPPATSRADDGFAARLLDLAAGTGTADEFRQAADAYATLRAKLSPVEAEVLDSIIRGQLNKQIAGQQGVSVRTVEERRRRAYLGMGVGSSTLLAFASGVAAALEAFSRECDNSQTPPIARSAG